VQLSATSSILHRPALCMIFRNCYTIIIPTSRSSSSRAASIIWRSPSVSSAAPHLITVRHAIHDSTNLPRSIASHKVAIPSANSCQLTDSSRHLDVHSIFLCYVGLVDGNLCNHRKTFSRTDFEVSDALRGTSAVRRLAIIWTYSRQTVALLPLLLHRHKSFLDINQHRAVGS
jgi:hypothetical protein